jgi:hypothetical protein
MAIAKSGGAAAAWRQWRRGGEAREEIMAKSMWRGEKSVIRSAAVAKAASGSGGGMASMAKAARRNAYQ